MRIAPRILLESFPRALASDTIAVAAAAEIREGGAKRVRGRRRPVAASLCEAWRRRPLGDGYRGRGAPD